MHGSEVKVADSKSKSYRKVQLQFSQATLKLFKDVKVIKLFNGCQNEI